MQLQLISFVLIILHCMDYTGCQPNSSPNRPKQCKTECDSCFNRNFCTRCRAGFYLHKGKCQENCPEGLVRSDTQRECVPECPAECESCVNGETCTRCRPGLYQLSGRCQHVCPEEYEPNDKLMECTPQVHCEVGEWSEWSPCSRFGRPCQGRETRTRQVLVDPSPLGKPCPETSETKECPVKRKKCTGGQGKNVRGQRRNRNNRKDKENQEVRRERKRERQRERKRNTGEREDSDNRNKTEHRHRRGQDTDPVSPQDGLVQ
ncbi:R-spondin-3-like isoform X2 [Thunnus thynnus]|uniref:R-spondin-3-like isoform X2 n=1 Tax=Thunnus thynnus TaxID=8237 RepID=UPI0035290D88